MQTLTGTRFSMRASVLKQIDVTRNPLDPGDVGVWTNSQDPLTGEIVRVWTPESTGDTDNTDTRVDERFLTIKCLARGIVDGGIRVAGTTERFGDAYQNVDFVKMWTPPSLTLTKRDRVTNIRSKRGHIYWIDEESKLSTSEAPKATVFNVNGVTPLFDAFNNHVENFVLLERAEI